MMENKSSDKSKGFLEEGKKLFDESRNFEALINLNRSLCFAENSLEIALCFELRAKIYFAIGQHQKCLNNILKLKKYENSSNLFDLEVQCIKKIEDETKFTDFFKLSHPPNNKNPSIINCLELRVNEKFGRHIVTTQSLNSGNIVAIEKPIHKSLNKVVTHGRCVNCFNANLLNLFPCSSCASVMFCSDECQKFSWESFHKFECSTIDDMTEEDSFLMMIQRSLFEILSFCGSLENLEKLIEENSTPVTAFDLDMNVFNHQSLNKQLILIGQSLECAPATKEDFKFAKSFVDYHEHVKTFWKTERQRQFLINFVVKFIGVMNRNAFKTHWPSPSADIEELGCAIFPTISMLSHSCSPNLFRIRVDDTMVLVTRKPIKANEQLFLAYHNLFLQKPKNLRQKSLFKQFNFLCSCDGCTNDYPLAKDLKWFDESFSEPSENFDSFREVVEAFKENCRYIDNNADHFPCFEICRLMQSNHNILQLIASNTFLYKNSK